MKIRRELNRPLDNVFKTDQTNKSVRSLPKHKLPDELKLKK